MARKLDFGTMKKKDRKQKKQKTKPPNQGPQLRYRQMLSHLFSLRQASATSKEKGTKTSIKHPDIQRVGTTRTVWVNFLQIAQSLNRPPDHMQQFIFVELSASGSQNKGSLILKGRYHDKDFEFLLKKYVGEYVKCSMCGSMNTNFERDATIRRYKMECEKCGCFKSINPIQEAYHHVSKADRKKSKMKE